MKVTKAELEALAVRVWGAGEWDYGEGRTQANPKRWECWMGHRRGMKVTGGGPTRMQARRNLKFAIEGFLNAQARQ